MPPPAEPSADRGLVGPYERWAYRALLLAIVLFALAIRAAAVTPGLPYTSYADEYFTLRPTAHIIADHTWQPGVYNYPPLPMYATAAVAEVLNVLPGGDDVNAGARATINQQVQSSILSRDLIVAGRLVVLMSGVATVLVVGLLATRLAGRRAGLIGAAFAALLPALVTRSGVVITDTPAAFFTTLSLLGASGIRGARRPIRWVVLASSAAGLATASKYTAGIVLIAALTVIVSSSQDSVRHRLGMACASVGTFAVAAVVAAPTLLLRSHQVLDEYHRETRAYMSKTSTTYWHELGTGKEVGFLFVAVSLVGCVLLLRSARTRPLTIGFVLFAVALVAPLSRYLFQPFRGILPVLPFMCAAAAVAVVALADAIGGLGNLGRTPRELFAGLACAGLCLVLINGGMRYYLRTRIHIKNSRINTVQWLARRVGPEDRILVAGELGFVPSELARLPARVITRSLEAGPVAGDSANLTYVIVGAPATSTHWDPILRDRRLAVKYGVVARDAFVRRTVPLLPVTDLLAWHPPSEPVEVFTGSGRSDLPPCGPFCETKG